MKASMLVMFLCLFLFPALAADKPLTDPQQEARARTLFKQLRCPVCDSESIADSNAELAGDLRAMVRERIAAGDSDEAIKQYLTERYGDVILMQPPVNRHTWLLWLGPLIILVTGSTIAFRFFRPKSESTSI